MSQFRNVVSATTTNGSESNKEMMMMENIKNQMKKMESVVNGEVSGEDVVVMDTHYTSDGEAVRGVLLDDGIVYTNPYDKNDFSGVRLSNGQMYNRDGASMRLVPGMHWGDILVVSKDKENKKVRLLVMVDHGGGWVEDYRSSYSPYIECENYSAELVDVDYYVDEYGYEYFCVENKPGVYYPNDESFNPDFIDFMTIMAAESEEAWCDDEVCEARRIARWRSYNEYTEDEIHEMLNEQYPMDVVVDAPGIRYEMDYDEAKEEMEWLESVMAKIDDKKYDSLTESDLWKIRYRLSDIRDMVNDATHEAVAVAY